LALFRRRVPHSWGRRVREILWPSQGYARSARYLAHRVKRLHATPHAIAAGFASGAAMSFLPAIGLHFLLSFALAWVLRGNLIAAALGTAIGNPLTFPIIYSTAYRLGRRMMSAGSEPPPDEPEFDAMAEGEVLMREGLNPTTLETLWPTYKLTLIGSLPLMTVAFVVFYALIYNVSARFQAARAHKRHHRSIKKLRPAEQG
jgi:uncharacterized protein (DUF2062 family)